MNNHKLTFLSKGQIWSNISENKLEVLNKFGKIMNLSDLCIVTGGSAGGYQCNSRQGDYWTKSDDGLESVVLVVTDSGRQVYEQKNNNYIAIRPVLDSSEIYRKISPKKVKGVKETFEVEYGEYPQYAANKEMQEELELQYQKEFLDKTGKSYTLYASNHPNGNFEKIVYDEYKYQEKKYIRVKANIRGYHEKLSNDIYYKNGDIVWIEVSPVKWLVDDKTKTLVSKIGLLSGIIYDNKKRNNVKFEETKIYNFINKYMAKDLFQTEVLEKGQDTSPEERKKYEEENEKAVKKENPYDFEFEQVSEEEIIKGAIESGVAVFLHGPSSEGKSARVKQIDPNCEVIYLMTATPDSLNGKSVYDSLKGEMIDIKPSWLKKLEKKCSEEPDKLQIVFFDEITNALPSIQGIAFNIILDKEVNGIWKLPENARVVAAGNEMKDSIAANQLAEPLFNRFAHVYIKTTTDSWLKWASEHNIHPAIYSFIAYKNGSVLRSEYNGETPNADPRKWEMASKMLYATKKPEMLRALVGEEITREFVAFCNQKVITLEDVINGNYSERDIASLNIAEKYATVMELIKVDEENLEIVRNFVIKLGGEFRKIFDEIWAHGDESRLEKILEIELINKQKKIIKK